MLRWILALGAAVSVISGVVQAQTCTSYPTPLVNGTTADAMQVMGNFNYLAGCLAPLASPQFSGNVVIGPVSSGWPLQLSGGSGYSAISFINTADSGVGSYVGQLGTADLLLINENSGGDLFLGTNNTSRIAITPAGNIGIGTVTPVAMLDVAGSIRSGSSYYLNNTMGTYRVYYVQTAGSTRWVWGSDNSGETGSNAGSNFYLEGFSDSGVGLPTPLYITRATGALTYSGPAAFTDGASIGGVVTGGTTGLTVFNNGTGSGTIAQLYQTTGTANNYVNSILSDGSTSTYQIAGGSALHTFFMTMPNYSFEGLSYGTPWLSMSAGNVAVDATPNASYAFYVNGQAAGTTSWMNVSDGRLKSDITNIHDALGIVERLRGVRFRWRAPKDREVGKSLDLPADETEIGMVAQEVAEVLPEATVAPKKGSDGFYGVKEGDLVPVLVEAVKQQQEEIKAQQTSIQAQQAQIDRLEALIGAR